MVLAAYNGGPGTVNKAIRRSGGKKTYWEIRPFLPRETQGYVPAFIAANYIMNYYSEHNIFPAVAKKNYFELDTVVVKETISFEQLSSILEVPMDEIQYFNPVYKKNVIPSGGNVLTLPKIYIGKFITNEEEIYAMLQKQSDSQRLMAETVAKEKPIYHTVLARENLTTISEKYGVSESDIKIWNFIGKNGVRPGKKLLIYVKDQQAQNNSEEEQKQPELSELNTETAKKNENNSKIKSTSTGNKSNRSENTKKTTYLVKRGDNLTQIARSHGLTIDELRRLNKFNKNSRLRPGQKLKVR
jgi:membrane-bound lytic murein transglycosylase D